MGSTTDSPRIYVACIKSYNEGLLRGIHIDATDDVDSIRDQIQAMLDETGGEEYAIHDYEGFGSIRLSEYEDLERVHDLACAIEEHGEAFALYVSDVDGSDDASSDEFLESYHGAHDSESDFAYELWSDCGMLDQVPEFARSYIDWESVAQDLFIDSYVSARDSSGNLHVFSRY